MSSPLTETPRGLRLLLRVAPRASTNELGEVRNGRLQVKVTAAPEDGQANTALIKLLSKQFGLPPSRIDIEAGHSSRDKTLLLSGMTLAELPAPLRDLLA